jgi:hypothetical protein
MLIAPLGTPASVRTFVWFMLIAVVKPSPSSCATDTGEEVPASDMGVVLVVISALRLPHEVH